MLIDAAILRDETFNEFYKKIRKIITFLENYKNDKLFLDYHNGKTVTYFWHAHRHE